MRLKLFLYTGIILFAAAPFVPRVAAQNPDTMMPEESAAKGRQLLNALINGFGGPGYAQVHESHCEGRRALFGHNGELTGYIEFADDRRYPDKDRTEYTAKGRNTLLASLIGIDGLEISHGGTIITLYNGDRGWTFDRSGVNEMPATAIGEFQEQLKRSVDNLLRLRLKEPGLVIRFGGTDIVDRKEVEWVELTDSEDHKFRLAIDRLTHLLVRSVVSTKNEETQQIDDDVTIYSNYQLKDTVWTPLQISREHNGRRAAQIFLVTCRFNPGFPDAFFSKDSLQKGGSEAALKKSKNDKN